MHLCHSENQCEYYVHMDHVTSYSDYIKGDLSGGEGYLSGEMNSQTRRFIRREQSRARHIVPRKEGSHLKRYLPDYVSNQHGGGDGN